MLTNRYVLDYSCRIALCSTKRSKWKSSNSWTFNLFRLNIYQIFRGFFGQGMNYVFFFYSDFVVQEMTLRCDCYSRKVYDSLSLIVPVFLPFKDIVRGHHWNSFTWQDYKIKYVLKKTDRLVSGASDAQGSAQLVARFAASVLQKKRL